MTKQDRNTAVKVWISEILNGKYVQGDEQTPTHIIYGNKTFSRVNILGVVLTKTIEGQKTEIQTIEVEDSTGKIQARTFDTKKVNIDIGDCIFLIGRVRTYNNQKYIAIEITKKINNTEWIQVRIKELPLQTQIKQEEPITAPPNTQESDTATTKIIEIIKQKDTGNGVDYDEIIKESKIKNAESILQTLIQNGEIFHVTSTKIKILE